MDARHQFDVAFSLKSDWIVLVVHGYDAISGIHRPDGHLSVLSIYLDIDWVSRNLPNAIHHCQGALFIFVGTPEMDCYGNQALLRADISAVAIYFIINRCPYADGAKNDSSTNFPSF